MLGLPWSPMDSSKPNLSFPTCYNLGTPTRTLWMFWEYGKLGQHAGPAMVTNGHLQAQSFISNLL